LKPEDGVDGGLVRDDHSASENPIGIETDYHARDLFNRDITAHQKTR